MKHSLKERMKNARRVLAFGALFSLPYIWLFLFLLIPLLFVLGISFTESIIAIPPYNPLAVWVNKSILVLKMNFQNYFLVLTDPLYAFAYWNSFKMAFWATLICFLVAYPVAYYLTQLKPFPRFIGLVFLMLPFWISFLVRVYAWIGLLGQGGLVCSALSYLGFISPQTSLVGTPWAVLIGLVYTYLPFMVLPVYTALEKLDHSLVEAALDLGCPPWKVFWRVVLPLSFKGAMTGAVLVFIPIVGEFTVPELLGGSKFLMVGQVIWGEFFYNHDWPAASALAMIMLVTLLIPILVLGRLQKSTYRQ